MFNQYENATLALAAMSATEKTRHVLTPSLARSQWEEQARRLIVSEMRARLISYKKLSRLLEAQGIDERPDQINRKINRRKFSAAFFLACLAAMEVDAVSVLNTKEHFQPRE